VPASDFAAAGSASVTLQNPSAGDTSLTTSKALSFTIAQPVSGSTWLRTVSDITAPNDAAWDSARGQLYVSVNSSDPAHASTLAVIDPVAGSTKSFLPLGSNPNLLSISSDGAYLWAGLDGSGEVERLLLPGLSKDISFPVPADGSGNAQQAIALQAAPSSPRTLGIIAGHWNWSPPGDGVYVFDDTLQRPNHVPGWGSAGPEIDWMQWGSDDNTIYGNQYTTIDAGGIATLKVDAAGVTLSNYGGGLFLQPSITQYDRSNGLLYSYGAAFDPVKLSLMGTFSLPGASACTADSSVGRYYCVTAYSSGGTNVIEFELWIFDLSSYALVDRVYFGASAGSSQSKLTGSPSKLVRWGKAGLAVLTSTDYIYGNGGVFLIDGAVVNPNAAPDTTSGLANGSYVWLSSLSPDSTTATTGEVQATIKGRGFTPDSTACWNCNFGQLRFLPTTYVSPTQLNVTIPLASVNSQPLEIGVFDQGLYLFSSNALTFTVMPASSATNPRTMNLCAFAMAWDKNSQLLYIGALDYDPAYPNSIVAIDPEKGSIVKAQPVGSDPAFLSESANGEYLYVAYMTNLAQMTLPGLQTAVTAPFKDPRGDTWVPGDMKAAPQDPHTVAATLMMPGFEPEALGGVTLYDDGTPRANALPGWTGGQTVPAMYDTVAWSASDQLLAAAASSWDRGFTSPLYSLGVDAAGLSYLTQGTAEFDTAGGYLHSDFGTGLIYGDGGKVADPASGSIVGNYGASGLAVPDSSLNRVFFLGQTAAQANSNNYTIESFDQKAFTPVSSITLSNVSGVPVAMVRWGNSGLAVLTSGGLDAPFSVNGSGMLYLLQDAQFVSGAQAASDSLTNGNTTGTLPERVHMRWKRMTPRAALAGFHHEETPRSGAVSTGVPASSAR
jgi:hypothetical protein